FEPLAHRVVQRTAFEDGAWLGTWSCHDVPRSAARQEMRAIVDSCLEPREPECPRAARVEPMCLLRAGSPAPAMWNPTLLLRPSLGHGCFQGAAPACDGAPGQRCLPPRRASFPTAGTVTGAATVVTAPSSRSSSHCWSAVRRFITVQ